MDKTTQHIERIILLCFLTLAAAFQLCAQGGPPMITDDTETVEKGHYEINTAFTMQFTRDGHLWGAPDIDWNRGMTKHTQLRIEIPYYVQKNFGRSDSLRAWGNTSIAVRWRFKDADEKNNTWAISMYPAIGFNTGSRARVLGIEDRGMTFLMPFQFQTKLSKNWSFNSDAGWLFKRGEDEFSYGGVVGREYKKFEILYELHATSPSHHFGDTEAVFNLGTRVPITKHATFLGSAGRSFLGSRDPQFIGYAGIQWTF